jgi:energy-coupling factor transporter ATP-binding protein EcfA2
VAGGPGVTGPGPVVVVRGAGYRYPGGVTALDGISLEVGAGDVVGIAGSNGAGKTTMARLLNGLLRPTTGTVTVNGADTRLIPVHELARTVGLVFQHPRTQLFARTVAEELAFGPTNLGLPAEEVAERVAQAADRFELGDVLARSSFELSGPRRRLVAIASVLAMRPRVLVLDEPTAGQDHRTAAFLAGLIGSLRDEGVGIVCVSHDMRLVASVATRLVALAAGRVVGDGSPRDVFADTVALAAAGLEAPQVTRLADAVPGLGGRRTVLTVSELLADLASLGRPPGMGRAPGVPGVPGEPAEETRP